MDEFSVLYKKFLSKEDLKRNEILSLLRIALHLIQSRHRAVRNFGQRILTIYAIDEGSCELLYEVALHLGLSPLVQLIERSANLHPALNNFHIQFIAAVNDTYKSGDIYLTEEQIWAQEKFVENAESDAVSLIAPTSYGKSDMMISSLSDSVESVCIIVPTKSLLAQTKRRVLANSDSLKKRKLITYPEMFNGGPVVAILTQERFLRLLKSFPKAEFELILVDEAHNLLDDDSRSEILASALIIAKKRNPTSRIRYFTPFLMNTKNLKLRHMEFETHEIRIDEYMKTENYYLYDMVNSEDGLLMYDQFIDDFIHLGSPKYSSEIDFIQKNRGSKNILYLNRPVEIEDLSRKLSGKQKIVDNEVVHRACAALADYVDKDYYLVTCLKRGVAYHHGSVPDIVKLYIESIYSSQPEISYIVTTSTLLEGVNIPAEQIFILDYKRGSKKLSPSQFKNLIGRVCRFREIFDTRNKHLHFIQPKVFLIKSEDYMASNANIKNFIMDSAKEDLAIKDVVKNVLLSENTTSDEKKSQKADEFLENIEPGSVIDATKVKKAKTEFGKFCFAHAVHEIDIIKHELACQRIVDVFRRKGNIAEKSNDVVKIICDVFIAITSNKGLQRFNHEKAQKFYAMFLEWKMENKSFQEMIQSFLKYWKYLEKRGDVHVFVGTKWGEVKIENSPLEMWVDISEKDNVERVNLAIVKIKEEQEFIDNSIMKFIEVLNDLNLIEKKTYLKLKYGTTNQRKILFLQNGLSSSLSTLLNSNKYQNFVAVDDISGEIKISKKIVDEMILNSENEILIFEMKFNVA